MSFTIDTTSGHATMQVDTATIDKIANAVTNSDFLFFGLRIEDGVRYEVGDYLPDSRIWVDDEPTDETLDGTSVIGLNNYMDDEGNLTADAVRQVLADAPAYFGTHIAIVGQDEEPSIAGDDPCERIFRKARCIMLIDLAL